MITIEEKYKCPGCGVMVGMDTLRCKHCGAILAINLNKKIGRQFGWWVWGGLSAWILSISLLELFSISSEKSGVVTFLFASAYMILVVIAFRPRIRATGMRRIDIQEGLIFNPAFLIFIGVGILEICLHPH
jgi:hypothetical protein